MGQHLSFSPRLQKCDEKVVFRGGAGGGARWAGKTFASGDLRNAAYGEGSETNATYVAFLQTETVTKSKKGKAAFFKRSRNWHQAHIYVYRQPNSKNKGAEEYQRKRRQIYFVFLKEKGSGGQLKRTIKGENSIRKAQMFLKVVLLTPYEKHLLFLQYLATACGAFHPGRRQIGRQVEGEDHKKNDQNRHLCRMEGENGKGWPFCKTK